MAKQGWFFPLTLLILMMMVHNPVHAKALSCDKVVISGEAGWPPFSYIEDGELTGVGVELGTLLFRELNIPVEIRTVQRLSDLEHHLRRGQVDLLVSTYDVPRYEKISRLVIPPYFEDTLAIIVPQEKTFKFEDWHDLMGYTGVTTANQQLGREFVDFSDSYLNIRSVGNLRYNFRKLARGEYEYIVGSAQLLKAGMNWYGKDRFEFLPMLVSAEQVHFAFSENSPCKAYMAHFRARLNELAQGQLISNLVQNHVKLD